MSYHYTIHSLGVLLPVKIFMQQGESNRYDDGHSIYRVLLAVPEHQQRLEECCRHSVPALPFKYALNISTVLNLAKALSSRFPKKK